jgi:hypothetical protein|tara:strand:+ start:601 stop:891 length:291 start_codon:yes stop_codon:yes gene_type:complete
MSKKEKVKHPSHYNKGIEMWDYAHSHNLDFFEGNIVKYITRWKDKNGIEDLHKAKQYLDKLIELEEKNIVITLENTSKELFDESMYMDLQEKIIKS